MATGIWWTGSPDRRVGSASMPALWGASGWSGAISPERMDGKSGRRSDERGWPGLANVPEPRVLALLMLVLVQDPLGIGEGQVHGVEGAGVRLGPTSVGGTADRREQLVARRTPHSSPSERSTAGR